MSSRCSTPWRAAGPERRRPAIRWRRRTGRRIPNLVKGDFEHGADGVPNGWDRVAGQQREPLGALVRWADEIGNPKNKVIRFTLDKNVAENEGVMYYSDSFPRRGRGQVPLPVPLALGRPGGEGLYQVLRRDFRKPRPARGLSQPAKLQGADGRLEHAHRGLYAAGTRNTRPSGAA